MYVLVRFLSIGAVPDENHHHRGVLCVDSLQKNQRESGTRAMYVGT